jgi:hypothetical protein
MSSMTTAAGVDVRERVPSAAAGRLTRWWPADRRESLFLLVAIVLVLWRSAVFLLHGDIDFDSDQATFGLMAKHLAEGRAFPLFLYGANYILAIEAWMAAPIFFVFGASVAALKFPLLAINLAVAFLLLKRLVHDVGLPPVHAFVAALFFLIPAPGTTTLLLGASGGNLEPLLYILLLWLTRERPGWFGLILGIGFLQREFTIYGAAAIAVLAVVSGAWRTRGAVRWLWPMLRSAAEVWLVVQWLRQFSSPAGPETTMAGAAAQPNNVVGMFQRFCIDPSTFREGLLRLITVHWPQLFGTNRLPTLDFSLESQTWQGMPGSAVLLGIVVLVMAFRIAMRMWRGAIPWHRCAFCAYLMLVGAMSSLVYALGRCGEIEVGTMRYDLLSLLGAVGLTGWYLAVENRLALRRAVVGLLCAWTMISATSHATIWAEYVRHPSPTDKQLILRHLDARGIRYIETDYWIAYYVAFMTNERIIASSTSVTRVQEYERLAAAHQSELIYVSREPCGTERPVIDGVYFCPPR